jgi:CheY-like chemotaxis protein
MVLVVDDDPDCRDSIVCWLDHAGYRVVAATDGRTALDLLHYGVVPDVIMLDLRMPVMDGWSFRRHQRADPRHASIPVIVVSADLGASELEGEPGVHDVLPKPVEFEVLRRSLERLFAV